MTERLHRTDPDLLEFEAAVVARRLHEGRPALVLDRTAFYAEGGGQPCDRGTLGGVPVDAVVEAGGEVLHVLASPLEADRVRGRVDGPRRRDHLQQHHGQHLLSRAFVETASARTVAFHLGAEASTIDLDRLVGEDDVRRAVRRANEVIREGRAVTCRTVSAAEASGLGLKLPPDAGEEIRLVEVAGFDLQPCSGTHPRSTSLVGAVVVTARERYKAGTRVHFLCGDRVLSAFERRGAVLEQLSRALSAPLEGLVEAAGRTLSDLAETRRTSTALREQFAEAEAARLAAAEAPGGVVVAAYEGWAPGDLRTLATRLVSLAPRVVLLGSREGGRAHLVFAQSEGLPHDLPALLRAAAADIGGRGGGRGNLAQGGGERAEALDAALARAAERLRAPRA